MRKKLSNRHNRVANLKILSDKEAENVIKEVKKSTQEKRIRQMEKCGNKATLK